ncbi:acyl-CoA dehydrogenase family protein [Sphingobium sp. JS3065]|uniref:acyl-CoA dehydrogenase family protein n=1 Tax=Sphingobium sp. JS3065 TaxID=2970925 RepID=UPI0022645C90|nr:acyl-CoA dehydrogenase family protein [Sphingobium sp. JS3065]UZW56404.1 acyl-CoA dehydrogenase family protein [Sphingobium sp. JS3065]
MSELIELPEDLGEFRRVARAWLAEQKFPVIPNDPDERLQALRDWQRYLASKGWLGLGWPVECGGRGLTLVHQAVFAQELTRAGGPPPMINAVDVVGSTIVEFGDDEQKRRLLPKMLTAEEVWCQGFSEPNSGSDLASLTTTAERVEGGFIVNGQKIWSTRATVATWIALLVRTDRSAPAHKGISYLVLKLDTPGITVRGIEQLNGEAEFAEVAFENVFVPEDGLLGSLNEGWAYAMHTLSFERGCYMLRRTTDLAMDFQMVVDELRAGGAPVEDWVARRIGELDADLYAFEAQSRPIAARLMARSDEPDVTDSLDKMVLAAFEQKLSRWSRELLGGYANISSRHPGGLDADRIVQRYYWSRAASIYGGTAQIQRNIVAERILGLPREGKLQ